MGSGTNRKWWAEKGSRTGGGSGAKAMGRRRTGDGRWKTMKAWRAEAARRSQP